MRERPRASPNAIAGASNRALVGNWALTRTVRRPITKTWQEWLAHLRQWCGRAPKCHSSDATLVAAIDHTPDVLIHFLPLESFHRLRPTCACLKQFEDARVRFRRRCVLLPPPSHDAGIDVGAGGE